MRKFAAMFSVLLTLTFSVLAQNGLPDIGIQNNLALGVVRLAGAEKLVIETKDGAIDVVLLSSTIYKRLSPDNLKLSAAEDAVLADITVGDRVLVTGKVSDDKKSIYSNKVFLVKGTDLEAQAAIQREEWQRRGIAGKITEVNAEAKTLSVSVSSIVGAATIVTVTPDESTRFKRYSENSARYSDAEVSEFSAIYVGDTVQALGDKSEDGLSFKAEEILSGSFVTVAGKVKSIDPDKNEAVITDIMTDKDVTVVVNASSQLKMFPEEMAQRFAAFQAMGGAAAVSGGGGRQGGRPGGGMGDINQLASRFPNITVAELKVGELIAVSSTKPKVPGRITAIKLFAGVGPFIAASAKTTNSGGRGVSGGISIPGLDGVDF